MEQGTLVKVTPKDGSTPYLGIVRGVHETGFTIWLDEDKKDEGDVVTVHTTGPQADATVEEASE